MKWLRRTRRVAMNPYEPPPYREPAAVETIVADGLAVAEAVVRMTVRNHIVVAVLRDRREIDTAQLERVAAHEFEELALHEREGAERQRARSEAFSYGGPLDGDAGSEQQAWRSGSRRLTVRLAMADAYEHRAAEPTILHEIVDRARREAWEQIGPVLLDRLGAHEVTVDSRYRVEREERIAALLALDFSELAAQRGVQLE